MARTVYSENLFRAQQLATAVNVTVPTGFTWVFRDISLVHRGTTFPANFSITLPISLNVVFASRASTADPQWQHYEGRWVFQQGDVLTLAAGASPWDVYICGYALQLP